MSFTTLRQVSQRLFSAYNGALPPAEGTHHGRITLEQNAATADQLYVCLRQPDGSFTWAEIVTADFPSDLTVAGFVQVGGIQATPIEVEATDDGTGTAIIPDGASMVQPVSDNADHYVVLPTPVPGHVVTLLPDVTGYELMTNDPEDVGINGGAEENASSSVGADEAVVCLCATDTNWVCTAYADDGTATPVPAAADPEA